MALYSASELRYVRRGAGSTSHSRNFFANFGAVASPELLCAKIKHCTSFNPCVATNRLCRRGRQSLYKLIEFSMKFSHQFSSSLSAFLLSGLKTITTPSTPSVRVGHPDSYFLSPDASHNSIETSLHEHALYHKHTTYLSRASSPLFFSSGDLALELDDSIHINERRQYLCAHLTAMVPWYSACKFWFTPPR